MSEHDVIVVGAGPAGEVCAAQLAAAGLDVALVERELVGGECAYWACMPAKALLRPGALLAEVRRVPGVHEAVTHKLDRQSVLTRRDEVIHDFDDSAQLSWVKEAGIALIRGPARLDGERQVLVGDRTLRARRAVVLAVGSGAEIPPVPGLRALAPWTNRQGTTAESAPERLTVLGGGAVGCELAQAWSWLGSRVTLVEALPRLLSGEEPFAGEQLAESLREQGVELRLGAEARKAERDVRGVFTLTLEGGEPLRSDELLVAVGRRPHTEELGLETIDLAPGETIAVDDRMRVPGRDWLYAIGDVNGRALLTHAAKYQARVATAAITNRELRAEWDGLRSPRVVFCEPQIAAVGQTLEQALEDGLPARALDAEIGRTAGASFVGKGAPARARLVIDEIREVIVGATFTGPEVADWLHAATIAIVGRVPIESLWSAVPAFPTRSEVWLKLLERRETQLAADENALTASRQAPGARRATFAAGCFWGVEAAFREIDGVLETTVGYTGGHASEPTYEQVCSHRTGHAEAVEVWFDPNRVTYGELLDTFWHIHSPTTPNRQGWDLGDQYRSAIFFHDSIQEGLAIATRNDAQQSLVKPIVTEIVPASVFYAAEEYHQRYFEKSGIASGAATVR